MSSSNTDVFRNGAKVATVANTGSYLDRLRHNARGTYLYRVCAAGTSTCSPTVSVRVGSGRAASRLTAFRASKHARAKLRRYLRVAARRR